MRQRVLWLIAGVLMASGGTWLGALIWKTSEIGGHTYGPHVLGGLLVGLTLARTLERRPVVLAAASALGWSAVQALIYLARGNRTPWNADFTGSPWTYLAIAAAVSVLPAVAGASVRLRGRPDHRLLWLWISGLATLGCLITSMLAVADGQALPPIAVVFILAAPLLAGGLVQVLAPVRMIWICGGGMLILALVTLDETFQDGRRAGDVVGAMLGMSLFVLFGALGARIAWRLFRNGEAPPTTAALPTATTRLP